MPHFRSPRASRSCAASRHLRLAAALALSIAVSACSSGPDRRASARADGSGGNAVVVMDFAHPPALEALPAGWQHRTFWTRPPMRMSLGVKDGVPAIRLATDASASMLMRAVDVELDAYPLLAWRWLIEKPIESGIDERTHAGDDHPARLFIGFQNPAGTRHRMEVIWGNKLLHAGDYKFIKGFAHYVANGGNEHVGRWFAEQIDLRAIYAKLWGHEDGARVTEIGLFCDSDETGGSSVAWFADVKMLRRTP